MRLSPETMGRLPRTVARFGYDRDAQAIGIVHIGIGAFHRAHQAWYTDRAMTAGDRDWAIAGVSLRSRDAVERLGPQDGLYTLTERTPTGDAIRLIGSVRAVIAACRTAERVVDLLSRATTRIVTVTITERGYCRLPDGDLDRTTATSDSIYAYLFEAFARRRAAGMPGLTLVSCDNLAANGRQFARLIAAYLDARDPSLARWFERECACPSTMVDRIVPAVTDVERDAVADRIGMRDEAAVITEAFSAWIIEDRFVGDRPRWDEVGARLVADVTPYETAKLRMLNGAHSALAYLGIERGHRFVHEAVADPFVRGLVEALMRGEAAPSIAAAPGQDLGAYADDLLARFANSALPHALAQIATDGSQKIAQRWLATLAFHQARGETCPAILAALGAWLRHVRGDGPVPVVDPMAGMLASAWRRAGADGIVAALFGPDGPFADDWIADPSACTIVTRDVRG